ncbi:MAG: hypothetical protein KUG51_03855 [Urechidicola sp.]|nr:hypothetical protein [Urechidicola sp.]
MQKKLNWEVFSNKDRNTVIESVKSVIFSSDGCLVNFTMFSDLAIALSVEIEENKIITLYNAISNIVEISNFEKKEININSKKEWLIFINVSFSKGKGELKIELPAVPG